jgi:RNA polymerase sigma-54 factor
LSLIQHFEPVGIASRNLEECLLAQVDENFNGHGTIAAQIIKFHLKDLLVENYTKREALLNQEPRYKHHLRTNNYK